MAAPRGPALLASWLRAGGEARTVKGRAWSGPGRGRPGPAEPRREHLRPCGCGCWSPAGGPGQVPGARARARGAGCTSCVGRSPLPRRGEQGRVWGPAESTKELFLEARGWEGEARSLSSPFSRKSALKKSSLSGLRREVGCLVCAGIGVEFSVGGQWSCGFLHGFWVRTPVFLACLYSTPLGTNQN